LPLDLIPLQTNKATRIQASRRHRHSRHRTWPIFPISVSGSSPITANLHKTNSCLIILIHYVCTGIQSVNRGKAQHFNTTHT